MFGGLEMVILNRYRINNITKFKRFIFLSILIFSFIVFASLSIVNAYSNNHMQYIYIYVEQGDTIWSIASNNNINNLDVRELVYKIEKVNNLNSSSYIHPGDTIIVPLY